MADEENDYFSPLPDEVKEQIFEHVPLKERLRTRRVSKAYGRAAMLGVTRLVFYSNQDNHFRYRLADHVLLRGQQQIVVRNWDEVASTIRQCSEVKPLASVKFIRLNFPAQQLSAMVNAAHYLSNLQAIEFKKCVNIPYEGYQAIIASMTQLVKIDFDFQVSVPHFGNLLSTILMNNPNIMDFRLRDTSNSYAQVELQQNMTSFHLGVNGVVNEGFWVLLEQNSGHTLRKFVFEYFNKVHERHLHFQNLVELRLANINFELSRDIIPSHQNFPNLRILTLRFQEGWKPTVAIDMTWIFEQHTNLQVLDIALQFRNENTLRVIADSCPNLTHLELFVGFNFTDLGVQSLIRLTNLAQLNIRGRRRYISRQQLATVIQGLPELRALRCNCTHMDGEHHEVFHAKAEANPHQLYFKEIAQIQYNQMGNVLHPDVMAPGFFFFTSMAPFKHIDYHDWKKLTQRSLDEVYGGQIPNVF